MKHLFVLLLLLFCVTDMLFAQETISATGGEAEGKNGSVSYSVGQVTYSVNKSTDGSISEGVQQPYDISVVSVDDNEKNNILLKVFPNPAVDYISLIFENTSSNNLSYQLFNIQGKIIQKNRVKGKETKIEMEKLTTGTYFLKIIGNYKPIKTFKIIKH